MKPNRTKVVGEKRSKEVDPLWRTAIHEAGHLFLYCHFGRAVWKAEIHKDGKDGKGGEVRGEGFGKFRGGFVTGEYFFQMIQCTMAGYLSEKVFFGKRRVYGSGDDRKKIRGFMKATHLFIREFYPGEVKYHLELKTEKIISENKEKIELLALNLKEQGKLTGKQARKLLGFTKAKTNKSESKEAETSRDSNQ